MLIGYIKKRYPNANIEFIVQKENKAHGLNDYVIECVKNIKPNLLIAPDSSSDDYNYHNILCDMGVDFIALDHHEFREDIISKNIQNSIVVVNNHANNNVNKYISAVGVVYLFIKLYDNTVFKEDISDHFLDLVSLGMVADSCDMRDIYTRKLTTIGIYNIHNPFILRLIEEQQAKIKKVNIIALGFYISPLINACIRMCDIEDRLTVFKAMAFGDNIEEAIEICTGAKKKQDKLRDKELKAIQKQIDEEALDTNGAIIVIKDDIPAAIVGLVANKLTDKYRKPAIVLRNIDGTLKGSIRNKIEQVNFKEWLESTGDTLYVAGHSSAAGIGLNPSSLESLNSKLPELSKKLGDVGVLIDRLYTPATIIQSEIYDVIENDDLWGNKIDEPYFIVSDIVVSSEDIDIIGKKKNVIKFKHRDISYLFFKADDNNILDFEQFSSMNIRVMGRFSRNEYNGVISLQFIIDEYEIEQNNSFFF